MCEGEWEEAGKRGVLLAYPELSWGGTEWSSRAAGYEHEPPKAAAYECIVLAILIFGCLGARDAAAAATHAARVTRKHTWPHHIATEDLTRRLGLDTADFYVARRQLRWLGHVARMDYTRLPRRMLSCWVSHKRPRGSPRMTYGRSVIKVLDTEKKHHRKKRVSDIL